MKKILVIDNYDSFVYNLVHYLEDLNCQVTVKRNDELYLEEAEEYDKILLSPGPGIPDEAGLLKEIIKTYGHSKPMLGVCLGQQAIAEVFGGKLINLNKVYHGVATSIEVIEENSVLFKDLPKKLDVGRYHSWVVEQLPDALIPTSYDENGQIMSIKHSDFPVFAVQFHPESVLTPLGKKILENWVNHA
ncbi:anthranilate synthase component 2 [Mesonia algae]|uniref:Anthranilate synthase component 2 n=1 Tax=Mesonia algae TaxID=213248 RepID=A0A2W7ILX6_9FLAO|nr:aminodeoxychorismate/anthranilate synthase component II [Mesonia algae]PZW39593.1 anthranilate synthase component 2 [Mesonia algae]